MLRISSNLKQSFPFLYSVASGNVLGVKFIKKFGFNPLVGSTSETVWDQGGLYQYATSPQLITISSSDANDADGDTGATTATVFGLDENYNEFEKDVILDGQNAVNVLSNAIRVYRIIIRTAGSSGHNEGNIYVGYGTVSLGIPAIILAVIRPTFNQTQMALYTVPAGYVAFLSDYYNNTGEGKDATVSSFSRPFGEVFQLKRIVSSFENNFYYPNTFPFIFDEKTDIEMRALSVASGAPVSAGFDLMLVDKEKYFGI